MFGNKNDENKEKVNMYEKYTWKLFRAVPENVVLVKYNTITGNRTIKASGLRISAPWEKGKFVTLASQPINYKEKLYRTKDELAVKVDIALRVHVVDAKQFEIGSVHPNEDLERETESIITEYIKHYNYDEIVKLIADKGKLNSELLPEYANLEKLLGIKVDNIFVQGFEFADPETKRQFEAARAQRQQNKEKVLEARANAKAIEILSTAKNEAEKNRIIKVSEGLNQSDQMNAENIMENERKVKEFGTKLGLDAKGMQELRELISRQNAINSQGPNVKTHVILNGKGSSIENAAAIFVDEKKNQNGTPNLEMQNLNQQQINSDEQNEEHHHRRR